MGVLSDAPISDSVQSVVPQDVEDITGGRKMRASGRSAGGMSAGRKLAHRLK